MDNLWDLAVQLAKKAEEDSKQTKDSTVIFVGNKQAGKSSIIYRFLDKHEKAKPTLALDFLFGRRAKGLDTSKEVCNIWELGGGTVFSQLLSVPITLENLMCLSIVLVLDLSVPEELWITMETLLTDLKGIIKDVLKSTRDTSVKEWLNDQAWKRVGETHEHKEMINPFPVPLLIIGSKYDIFQDFDPEKKKVICKCLRFVSYINGAALAFVSLKSESLINKGRVIISHLCFGTPSSKTTVTDYNKPIFIPFGGDSLENIGNIPMFDSDPGNASSRSLDMWKHSFVSYFPQVVNKITVPDDPGKDPNFKERDIDIMREQKDKELEEYRSKIQQKTDINF